MPEESSTTQEKGMYALFMMLLFRAHRSIDDMLDQIVGKYCSCNTEDALWKTVYDDFLQWRQRDIVQLAEKLLPMHALKQLKMI